MSTIYGRELIVEMAARVDWSESETVKLIEVWGEESIQSELEGCKRNKQVYDKIARELKAAGFERTAVQCRDKIKKLRGEYKKVKDHNDETGRDRKSFVFDDQLNDILGHRPSIQPEHIIDTSAETVQLESEAVQASSLLVVGSDEELDRENSCTDELVNMSREEEHEKSDSEIETRDHQEATAVKKGLEKKEKPEKKRKRPAREGAIERAMDMVVNKMVKFQEASDEHMYAIEEKRVKLDERLMEIEERRWKEQQEREDRYRREQQDREEQRRREERQFQLQMMQMMSGRPSFPPPSFNMFNTSPPGPSGSERMYHWPNDDQDL